MQSIKILTHIDMERAMTNLQTSPKAAGERIGKHKPEGVGPVDAAAWVAVTHTILNLDEFVTRE